MRGDDGICGSLFSYIDLEKRVRAEHPLRVIRQIANAALTSLSGELQKLYSPLGRVSIPPERLMRALLLQAFYSIRSERQLVERIDTDLLFRWFVGLGIEDPVWDATTFTKNRDRLLDGEVANQFLAAVLSQDRVKRLLSSDHFSVDGTLLEAWASPKSFRPKDGSGGPPGPGRNSLPQRRLGANRTFTASGGPMIRTPRPPTPTPASTAKGRARRRGCVSSDTR
jgi:transposase